MNSDCTTQAESRESDQDTDPKPGQATVSPDDSASAGDTASGDAKKEREIGGRKGPDPTRYGDWEKGGRCIDF